MGCAASGKRRQLEDQREDAEHEVGALKRQLEEKNRELTSLRESQAAGDVETPQMMLPSLLYVLS